MGFFDLVFYPLNYNLKQEERQWQEEQAGRQMDFQYDMMLTQMQHQEDFYNQYQSPAAMVRQYQDAGINPALMFGKGGSFSSPISQGAIPNGAMPNSTGSFDVNMNGFIEDIFNTLNLRTALKQEKLENENIAADTGLKQQQTKLLKTEEMKLYHEVMNLCETNKKIKAEIETEAARKLNIEANTELTTQQAVSEVVRQNMMEAEILLKGVQVAWTTADTALKGVQKQAYDKQMQLTDEQIKTEVQRRINMELEEQGLTLHNLGLDIDNQGKLITLDGKVVETEESALRNAIFQNTGVDPDNKIFGPISGLVYKFINMFREELPEQQNLPSTETSLIERNQIRDMRNRYWEYRKRIYNNDK